MCSLCECPCRKFQNSSQILTANIDQAETQDIMLICKIQHISLPEQWEVAMKLIKGSTFIFASK